MWRALFECIEKEKVAEKKEKYTAWRSYNKLNKLVS